MDFKVLVNVYVPEIETNFEFYIPINKYVNEVVIILNNAINDLTHGEYPIKENLKLYNRRTGECYDLGKYVRNTNIKNGTQLVII